MVSIATQAQSDVSNIALQMPPTFVMFSQEINTVPLRECAETLAQVTNNVIGVRIRARLTAAQTVSHPSVTDLTAFFLRKLIVQSICIVIKMLGVV
jgi:hypothetical protein